MDDQRRTFLRKSLVVLGAAATGGVARKMCCGGQTAAAALPSSASMPDMPGMPADHQSTTTPAADPARVRAGVPGRRWVMVIDLAKCDGCGHCTSSCGKMHAIPADPDRQFIKVLRMRDSAETAPYFFPQPCYHCDNPPCTKVCPVDATFKRDDGVVLIDNDRCIGCRFCMAACPYGARHFNWGHPNDPPEALAQPYSPETGLPRRVGTVEKCDFCPDMAAKGMLPACTAGCPMGAIYYGDENEDAVTNSAGQTERLSTFLRDNGAYRHKAELGTEPRVYYLPPKNRIYAPPPNTTEVHNG